MIKKIAVKKYSSEIKALFGLAVPLIASGFIENSIGFFSTLFLAHLGKQELAAGALVAWVFATLMVIMWGMLSAISTLVARHYGEQNNKAVAIVLRDGLWIATFATIPVMAILWNLAPLFAWFGQDPETVKLTEYYLHGLAWGVFPDFILTVLLHFYMGLGKTRVNLFFSMLWVPINIAANYVLMFGKWGFPAMGIAGIGWGTTATFWIMVLLLALYTVLNKNYRIYSIKNLPAMTAVSIKELLRVGMPMGAMFCIEIGFFMTVTLLMGAINQDALAANQIAMQYLAQLSIITFSIAQAITVRIGHVLGEGNILLAKRAGYLGVFLAFIFMSFVAVVYWIFPEQLIGIDLDVHAAKNQLVVELAKQFLAICALFQLFEAIRFAAFGALRGIKDTQFTMWVSIITFWLIALPLGYFFAVNMNWGGAGVWWAMVFSQTIGATILVRRFQNKISLFKVNVNNVRD